MSRRYELMAQDYARLQSSVAVAALWGCDPRTVGRAVVATGGRMRPRRGSTHARAKGGTHQRPDGYVTLRYLEDPLFLAMRNKNGCVLEHRYVMAQYLGRPLTAGETVHHINGDRADNRIENLQLRVGPHGVGQRWRCTECGSHSVEAVAL